jgi:hypothetical protein
MVAGGLVWLIARPKAPPPAGTTEAPAPTTPTERAKAEPRTIRTPATSSRPATQSAAAPATDTRKRCNQDSDCPTGLVCIKPNLVSSTSLPGICRAGDCRDDADCGPDASCSFLDGSTRCVEYGDLRENAECDLSSSDRARHCARGLLCVDQVCLPTCTVSKTGSSCPDGRRCVGGGKWRFCEQGCDPSRCAPGERCVTLGVRAFCGAQIGENCQKVVCPNLEDCVTAREGNQVFFECAASCDESAPCPSGFICAQSGSRSSTCVHACSRDADCGAAGKCAPVGAQQGCIRYDPRK